MRVVPSAATTESTGPEADHGVDRPPVSQADAAQGLAKPTERAGSPLPPQTPETPAAAEAMDLSTGTVTQDEEDRRPVNE
jgi:hypothetical protein